MKIIKILILDLLFLLCGCADKEYGNIVRNISTSENDAAILKYNSSMPSVMEGSFKADFHIGKQDISVICLIKKNEEELICVLLNSAGIKLMEFRKINEEISDIFVLKEFEKFNKNNRFVRLIAETFELVFNFKINTSGIIGTHKDDNGEMVVSDDGKYVVSHLLKDSALIEKNYFIKNRKKMTVVYKDYLNIKGFTFPSVINYYNKTIKLEMNLRRIQ